MGGFKDPASWAVIRTCVRRRSLQYRLSTTFLSQKWHLRLVCPSFKRFLVTTLQMPTSISVWLCVWISVVMCGRCWRSCKTSVAYGSLFISIVLKTKPVRLFDQKKPKPKPSPVF
jgi:ferredoxin